MCTGGAFVEKELTALLGSHLIGKNIDRSSLMSRGHGLTVGFVMTTCTDQIHVPTQLNVSF